MTIDPDDPVRAVEAVLFAAEEPLTIDSIRAHVGEDIDVRGALERIAEDYAGRGIELVRRGDRERHHRRELPEGRRREGRRGQLVVAGRGARDVRREHGIDAVARP